MKREEIEVLADEIMDDLHTWGADLRSYKEQDEVWAGIKKDITCTLRNALEAKK